MRNIITICRREIGSYFASPIAYALIAFFGIVNGIVFWLQTEGFIRMGMSPQRFGQGQALSVNEMVIVPVLGTANFLSLLFIPFITMRLFAREKNTGTIELLMTSPLHDWEIVVGKWMGSLVMYSCLVLMVAIEVGLLFLWGSPDGRPVLTGFLGVLLQGACILAIGTFISTTTKNEIIAGFVTLAFCLSLLLLQYVSEFNPEGWAQAISYCSIVTHFEPFSKGVIDTKDLVFYISAIFLGLFLTTRSLESLRWRA